MLLVTSRLPAPSVPSRPAVLLTVCVVYVVLFCHTCGKQAQVCSLLSARHPGGTVAAAHPAPAARPLPPTPPAHGARWLRLRWGPRRDRWFPRSSRTSRSAVVPHVVRPRQKRDVRPCQTGNAPRWLWVESHSV